MRFCHKRTEPCSRSYVTYCTRRGHWGYEGAAGIWFFSFILYFPPPCVDGPFPSTFPSLFSLTQRRSSRPASPPPPSLTPTRLSLLLALAPASARLAPPSPRAAPPAGDPLRVLASPPPTRLQPGNGPGDGASRGLARPSPVHGMWPARPRWATAAVAPEGGADSAKANTSTRFEKKVADWVCRLTPSHRRCSGLSTRTVQARERSARL